MRASSSLIALLLVVLAVSVSQSALAKETAQVSNSVSLQYLTVKLAYPSEVMPGDVITVNVQGIARESFRLQTLTVQVYLSDGTSLRQLTSATLAKDIYMSKGDQINKDLQTTVPADAVRTSLIALVSETASMPYYDYSYYYAFYPYSYYYPWYGNYSYYYVFYPSYSHTSVTDNGIAPLSYIKATTPEYVSLQAEYQMLQQQLDQSKAENDQLKQTLNEKQANINQLNSDNAGLNQQLTSARGTIALLEIGVIVLAVVVIAIMIYTMRGRSNRPPPAGPEPAPVAA